jgi:hypothetical protein
MELSNFFKWFWAIPAISSVIVSRGTLITVNILKALGKTATGKVIGDAKCTDRFNDFLDDWAGSETMADAFGLLIKIVIWQRIVIGFQYEHDFNVLTTPI